MSAGLRILHQDAHLLAVDKPAGRLVIPGRGAPERSLREEVEALAGRVWVVHRLDRGTSGVLLFARTAEAHRTLNMAFDRQGVSKRYLAIVRGEPPEEQRVDVALAPARRGRMRPARPGDARAKAAATYLRTLERYPARPPLPALALLEAVPETGRTHQIRVHLAEAGCPLALDPDYGEPGPLLDAAGSVLLDRTPLHASRLELEHPATGQRLVLEAPLPDDMERMLAAARG
ncbi:MAG TPA: RluA family pseudouridine synthase [Anaeromyxobacteraceae bacterium]|nr:RluA family pseudouridine synthase [Anaeromyxobacteraceae bacterium]